MQNNMLSMTQNGKHVRSIATEKDTDFKSLQKIYSNIGQRFLRYDR